MKTVTYTCDNSECINKTDNIEEDNWIEIGSKESSLKVNNYLKDRYLISLGNYTDIHFCSSKCFIEKFVKPNTNQNETK